jgi:hypothetical protein
MTASKGFQHAELFSVIKKIEKNPIKLLKFD